MVYIARNATRTSTFLLTKKMGCLSAIIAAKFLDIFAMDATEYILKIGLRCIITSTSVSYVVQYNGVTQIKKRERCINLSLLILVLNLNIQYFNNVFFFF